MIYNVNCSLKYEVFVYDQNIKFDFNDGLYKFLAVQDSSIGDLVSQ